MYLDEATGLPNKNKCEEILNAPDLLSAQDAVAICVFDLNNLRNINNNLGHDKGDEYIRSFAVQLRIAVADEYFVGRDGGDEFISVLKNLPCGNYSVMQIKICTLIRIVPKWKRPQKKSG